MEICAVDKLAVQRNMTRQRKPRIVMVGAVEVFPFHFLFVRFGHKYMYGTFIMGAFQAQYIRSNNNQMNCIRYTTLWAFLRVSLADDAVVSCRFVFTCANYRTSVCHTIPYHRHEVRFGLTWQFMRCTWNAKKKHTHTQIQQQKSNEKKRKQAWKSNLWYTLVLKAVHWHAKRNEMHFENKKYRELNFCINLNGLW